MIPFTKLHGAGNDYIYIDGFKNRIDQPEELSRQMSDRHFGVGSDGMILVNPGQQHPVAMRMFNSNGAEGEMCGNGLRCLVKYAFDHGLVNEREFKVETKAGVRDVKILEVKNGKAEMIQVDMGIPIWDNASIPIKLDSPYTLGYELSINKSVFTINGVNTGVPHVVIFLSQDPYLYPVEFFGPKIECHPIFPEKTNVNFAQIINPQLVIQRTWERASGETLACGTGSTAIFSVGYRLGFLDKYAHIRSGGGELILSLDDNQHVFMTGPAVEVFTGSFPYPA